MSDAAVMPSAPSAGASWIDRWARRLLVARLARLQGGGLSITNVDADAETATDCGDSADPQVHVRVRHPRFYRRVLAGGTLAAAESYLDGDWDCDDLTELFRLLVRNRSAGDRLDSGGARLGAAVHRLAHWFHANSRAGSRRNIGAHYDLGNEFFARWLDDTMAYSCAIFPTPTATLAEASAHKFDRACQLLDLQADDHLLEIGTGWGGLALHAAQHYGCRVTSTTISAEQLQFAQQRVTTARLDDRITLLAQDYRDLQGTFDKLVSIEMIEAVGHRYLDGYFRQCGQLLRPNGSFVLQAIVMPDRGYERYLRSVDFIQRYIFPGGCLPSLKTILESVARVSDLQLSYAEDFSAHYAETLRRWRYDFRRQLDVFRSLGCSESFLRMWDYYLCYCEAAFDERAVGLLQLRFDKPARGRKLDCSQQFTASAR